MKRATLHEFISSHREEILDLCVREMKERSPDRSEKELATDFHVVIDEIVRALQENAGLPRSSPLPGPSRAASQVGGQRQRLGYTIEKIALDFGTISAAVGELGSREDLWFAAREYQVFNQCVDTSIASALEQYSTQSLQQQEDETAQRVGFIAHELRNAVSTVRMSFAMLKSGRVGLLSKTSEVLERGLTQLENLINQMLLAAHLRAHSALRPQRTRVRELFDHVEGAAVLERDIHVTVEADERLEMEADERLIVSAVSNLLQNAIKFSRSGGVVVLRGRHEGECVLLEVEDECGGLPSGVEQELFKPYVQHGPDRRGLGLGLAITREAIDAHGGEIAVRNLPGKGCVFAVRLPARAGEPTTRSV